MHQDVWLLTGTVEALRDAAQVSPGDVVVQDRGQVLAVGRVADGLEIDWSEEVDADLLPERAVLDQGLERPGPTQRIQEAPALFEALTRLEEADRLRGA